MAPLRILGGSDLEYWPPNEICQRAYSSGFTSASIDAIPLILSEGFQVGDYTAQVDRALDKIKDFNGKVPEVIYAQSVGTLAVLEAIARRIIAGKEVPHAVILVDTLLGGLSPLAEWFIKSSRQTDGKVPALIDIRNNSVYLNKLQTLLFLDEVQQKFPFVYGFYGDMEKDFAAPFGAIRSGSVVGRKLKSLGIPPGGDGMVDTVGASLTRWENGPSLFPSNKQRAFCVPGADHRRTRLASAGAVQYILGQAKEIFQRNLADNTALHRALHDISIDSSKIGRHPSKIEMVFNEMAVGAILGLYGQKNNPIVA